MSYLELVKSNLEVARDRHLLSNHFKIGKTTQPLEERFSQNYEGKYYDIELLLDAGEDGALIDWLEEELIKYCLEEYAGKECDNEQIGGDPACKDNTDKHHSAKLYVVFR